MPEINRGCRRFFFLGFSPEFVSISAVVVFMAPSVPALPVEETEALPKESFVTAAPTVSVSVSEIPRLEELDTDAAGTVTGGGVEDVVSVRFPSIGTVDTRVGVILIFFARLVGGAITTVEGPDSHGGRGGTETGGGISLNSSGSFWASEFVGIAGCFALKCTFPSSPTEKFKMEMYPSELEIIKLCPSGDQEQSVKPA